MRLSVASVTVNANGGQLLMRQIEALMTQMRPLDEVIVVDNGSTDGSMEMAHRQSPALTVLPLGQEPRHRSCPFSGVEVRVGQGTRLDLAFRSRQPAGPRCARETPRRLSTAGAHHNMGILSCLPVHRETGTEYHGMIWRDRFRSVAEKTTPAGDYFADSVVSSGSLVKAEAVRKAGYPRADFFIDFVDHEFNLRLRRHGYQIAVIRESGLSHRIGQPQQVRFGWRRWLRPQSLRGESTIRPAIRRSPSGIWSAVSGPESACCSIRASTWVESCSGIRTRFLDCACCLRVFDMGL